MITAIINRTLSYCLDTYLRDFEIIFLRLSFWSSKFTIIKLYAERIQSMSVFRYCEISRVYYWSKRKVDIFYTEVIIWNCCKYVLVTNFKLFKLEMCFYFCFNYPE